MTKIKSVRHVVNEKVAEEDGEPILERVDQIEYNFGNDVSDDAKKAVRDHVPRLTKKSEIRRVIESVDGHA